ncbi:MAG: pyridoxamine 5'-phosphate oxidase family protein, partial [Vicinamibacteria bacterium]
MAIDITPRVAERLAKEQVIWLTTTKADGTPLPNPVWFFWDGRQFLIFTEPDSVKMGNMTRNPRVALNLNTDFDGDEVAIFQAVAEVNG